jgi:peptide/nickel transport system permease protein
VTTYVLRRLLGAIPLLFGISIACFLLMHYAPGGPLARLMENPRTRPEDIAALRHNLGLDKPVIVQYGIWLRNVLTGNFGSSYVTGEPVLGMIAQRIPATMELMLSAFGLSLVVGLGLGIVAGLRPSSRADYALTLFAFVGISVPVFWLGMMSQVIFGVKLDWLPVTGRGDGGWDEVRHLILPMLVLSLLYTSSWSRYMRATLIEVMSQDYVRTARAKGLAAPRVIVRHAVRNALIPVVTIMCLQIPGLFTGAIITEAIFAWPGMGRLFYDGIGKGDYPRVMAILVIASALIVLFNLVADVLYGLLDPRISYA